MNKETTKKLDKQDALLLELGKKTKVDALPILREFLRFEFGKKNVVLKIKEARKHFEVAYNLQGAFVKNKFYRLVGEKGNGAK